MFTESSSVEAMAIAESNLLASHPFFASLLYNVMTVVPTQDKACPTAATDGKTIWINTNYIAKLTLLEVVFLYCHEITHAMLLHCPRGKQYGDIGFGPDMKPWNRKKWNHATDYVINAMLTEAAVGKMPLGGLINPQITGDMIADEVYKIIPDPDPDDESGFDDHLDGDALTDADATAMDVAVRQAANVAKATGKLPGSLGGMIERILNPTVDWRDVLMQEFSRAAADNEMDYNRPERRRLVMSNPPVILPSLAGTTCGTVVFVIDTSGSISNTEAGKMLGEAAAICSNFSPEEVYVLWTDTKVAHVDHIEDECEMDAVVERCRTKPLPGGGGTNMPAAFDYIRDWGIEPDTCIVFTDGYTPFGEAQPYPVVWGITTESIKDVPHGTHVYVPVEG